MAAVTTARAILSQFVPMEILSKIPDSAFEEPVYENELERSYAEASRRCEQYNKMLKKRDEDGFFCQICGNKGYVMTADLVTGLGGLKHYEATAYRCQCWEKRAAYQNMLEGGSVLARCRFDNFIAEQPYQQAMLEKARDFAATPKGALYIGGQVGAGKTHICMAAMSTLIEAGHRVQLMNWDADIDRIKTPVDGQSTGNKLKMFMEAEILYIEDFYRHRVRGDISDADRNIAYALINVRYTERRPTIINSELTLGELINLDPAVGSRINEMCGRNCVNINKDDAKNWRLRRNG